MYFILFSALISLTMNQLPVGETADFFIEDKPVYFYFEADSRGYLSVVIKSSDFETDLTLSGRGPNTFFLEMSPSVIDIDAGGNTGAEQAVFTIPSPGTYYIIANPYSALPERKEFSVLSWFYATDELIGITSPLNVLERPIGDLENVSGYLNQTQPIAIFEPGDYDLDKNLIYARAEANGDIMLELYLPSNPLSYLLQSDYDLEGNAGIEEILYYSAEEKPLIIVRPYGLTDTGEIFFNIYFELLSEDDNLVLSSNKAFDEAYLDPEKNIFAYIYSLSLPLEGMSVVNLLSEDADLVLFAFSGDSMFLSDNDLDGILGKERLVLPGGKYFIVIANNPNSRQYTDFNIEAVHHPDRDASRANANPIVLGARSNNQLSFDEFDFVDYFVFTADRKATYTIETQGTTGEGDLVIQVEDLSGEVIASSDIDNNGDPTNELCTIELDRGQKVYVKVYPYTDYDGFFTDCIYYVIVTME